MIIQKSERHRYLQASGNAFLEGLRRLIMLFETKAINLFLLLSTDKFDNPRERTERMAVKL